MGGIINSMAKKGGGADSGPLGGEEVGRLVLRDLAAIYKNSREGREPTGILSPAEKADLVNSLTEPADVARYNEFRYVHEYLSRAAVMFILEETTAESCFFQLAGLLEALRLAESENAYFLLDLPRLMTRRELAEAHKLFDLEGKGAYGRGLAVLETDDFPPETYNLDKKGRYLPLCPEWRRAFMAENVLAAKREDVVNLLADFRAALREALVIKTAVGLMGRFVGVPEAAEVVGEVHLGRAAELNRLMTALPELIVRRGLFPGERPAEELAAELRELLVPVRPESLKPTAAAVRKARRAVDFSIAQGNSEKLYAILREEG